MAAGRLATRFVSWLDEALAEMAKRQPKQTPDQIMAQLTKNPRVSMDEISDRGFDQFLASKEGTLDLTGRGLGSPRGFLERNPMQAPGHTQMYGDRGGTVDFYSAGAEHMDWATRDMDRYREQVFSGPWTGRQGSPHYPDYEGYSFHTRGGQLPETNLGQVQVLDEVQRDVRNVTKQFNPHARQGSNLADLKSTYNEIYQTYSDPPKMIKDDPAETLRQARQFRDDLAMEGADTSLADAFLYEAEEYASPLNLPARKRWEWQGQARGLQEAVQNEADALVWPAGDTQYRRYFQRDLPYYQQQAQEELIREGTEGAAGRLARKAERSQKAFQKQYDTRMPKDPRWKQLGLEPELIDLERNVKLFTHGGEPAGIRAKPQGKYWAVRLTPEIRERLVREGIPFYTMGGMAVLGAQDGALAD